MDLMILGLVFGNRHTRAVKDDKTRTGGTLINGTDEAIFEVILAAVFILQEGAIAIVGLVGVGVNLRLGMFLEGTIDIGHIKRVSHGDGVCSGRV